METVDALRLFEFFGPWAIALVLLVIGIIYLYKRNEHKSTVIEKQSDQYVELLNRLISSKEVEAEITKELTKVLEALRSEIQHSKELHEKSIQHVKDIVDKL